MLEKLIAAVLRRHVIVVAVALISLAFGVDATRRLSVDAFPDVTSVQVQVATVVPGRSPDEVERLATIPLEIAMTGLPGLVEMRSHNAAGLSIVTLVFTDSTPVYFARQLVAERVGEVRDKMPANIIPVLGPVSTVLSEVYQYTIERPDDGQRPLSRDELVERRTVQDWVARPLLRSVPGVAEINSTGGYVKQYQVLVDPVKMRYYGVTIADVHGALTRNNANTTGGILPQGPEFLLVRSLGLIGGVEDIGSIVIKEFNNTPVYLKDLAAVRIGEDVRYGAMVKGGYTESVGGIVMMVAAGNAKEIVGRIKRRVEEINSKNLLPGGLRIVPYYDRSELVDAAIATIARVLQEGIILVVIVLFLFLGDLRSSIVVIATLILTPPLTFLVMRQVGMSANLMSLGGLAIAVGLMVDASVVVVENVYAHLGRNPRANRLQTILNAVVEVAVPVIFGISIIIVVFLPLMTLEGMEGKMFSPLAYTIAIALAISLAISLVLSPVLCRYLLKGGSEHDTPLMRGFRRVYAPMLRGALRNPLKTSAVALAAFAGSLALVPFLGATFIPEFKEGTIAPNLDRVPNISLDESIQMEMEAIREIRKIPGVKHIVSRLGRGESPVDPAGYNENDMMIQLLPLEQRPGIYQEHVEEKVRAILARFPGVNLVMAQPISDRVNEMVTGVRADVAVKIFGDDLMVLLGHAREVARLALNLRGTADVKIDRVAGQMNLDLAVDRQTIARHGLSIEAVNDVVEAAVGGRAATQVYERERRFQVVVRYPEPYRNSLEKIRSILLKAPDDAVLPVGDLGDLRIREGISLIKREMARRRVVVAINIRDRDLGGYVSELQDVVAKSVRLPSGHYAEYGGQFQNMTRARRHLSIIVPITIGTIFFLLFLLFQSLRAAALIILVLPFASIGGILSLLVWREYLSVPASVGFIALWGIAVLNGVVLISYIRKLRASGIEVSEAVRRGAEMRFRPVMMTATIAALGLAPFLFATGPGAEVQRPLAIVVIGGLATSTLLTLVMLPAIYRFFDEPVRGASEPLEDHGPTGEAPAAGQC
jgi:cobalt-zinc-cadmium resistance protein CzcA